MKKLLLLVICIFSVLSDLLAMDVHLDTIKQLQTTLIKKYYINRHEYAISNLQNPLPFWISLPNPLSLNQEENTIFTQFSQTHEKNIELSKELYSLIVQLDKLLTEKDIQNYEEVKNHEKVPWVGLLYGKNSQNPEQPYIATATLISPNLLLTSAHDLFDEQGDLLIQDLKFYLNEEAISVDYGDCFSSKFSPKKDIALLRLNKSFDFHKEYPEIKFLSRENFEKGTEGMMNNSKILIFGYLPTTNDQFRLYSFNGLVAGSFRELSWETFLDKSECRFFHNAPTGPGTSGGPIFWLDEKAEKWYIVGVNTSVGATKQYNTLRIGVFLDKIEYLATEFCVVSENCGEKR